MKAIHNDFATTISDDVKAHTNKFVLSKAEDELYKEEDNVVMPVIRVKYFALPNKGDKWKVFSNNEVIMVIMGTKLNKKECAFLRSLEGTSFLIAQVKAGVKSFNGIHKALKNRPSAP